VEKNKTNDSEQQSTLMPPNAGENNTEQHGYTNGHSKKLGDDV